MTTLENLPTKDAFALALYINDQIDCMSIKRGESNKVGGYLLEIFSKAQFAQGEIASRINCIDDVDDLSPSTKDSFRDRLVSISELFDHPEGWTERSNFAGFQRSIVSRVCQLAEQLLHLSEEMDVRNFQNRQEVLARAKNDQVRLKRIAMETFKKSDLLRCAFQARSILTEEQQREEETLYFYIQNRELEKFRDPTVPLNEDEQLIRHLAQDPYHWFVFNWTQSLFKCSKPAALILLSEGVKPLAWFDRSLLRDKKVLLASRQKKPEAVHSPSFGSSPKSTSESQPIIYTSIASLDEIEPREKEILLRIMHQGLALNSIGDDSLSSRSFSLLPKRLSDSWTSCIAIRQATG